MNNGIYVIAAGLGILGLGASLNGCSLGDVVKSDIPLQAQKTEQLPPQLSHNNSIEALETYVTNAERTIKQWQEAQADSGRVVSFIEGFSLEAWTAFSPALQTVPYGGLISTALIGIGGLLLPRPGEKKKLDQAYDMGREEALDTLKKVN